MLKWGLPETNLKKRKRHSTMKLCCCMWTDSWRHFSLAHPLPAPRSSLYTFFVKGNVLNIGQILLQSELTILNYLTPGLISISSGFGPLCSFSSSNWLFDCFLSFSTGFCSKSAQLCAPKPITGIDRSKCNFPEQERGENLNAILSHRYLVPVLPIFF